MRSAQPLQLLLPSSRCPNKTHVSVIQPPSGHVSVMQPSSGQPSESQALFFASALDGDESASCFEQDMLKGRKRRRRKWRCGSCCLEVFACHTLVTLMLLPSLQTTLSFESIESNNDSAAKSLCLSDYLIIAQQIIPKNEFFIRIASQSTCII